MQNKLFLLFSFFLATLLTACIGDDIIFDTVEEQVRIMNSVDTIGFGEEYQFEVTFLNNVGMEEAAVVEWSSSNTSVITINEMGLAKAITSGSAEIYARVNLPNKTVADTIAVIVGENTVSSSIVRTGKVMTTSSYAMSGSFSMEETDNGVRLSFGADYNASTALPGLYIYLSNNKNTINGALTIGAVEVFEGEHSYTIDNVDINQYEYILYWCKPFNVDVGLGEFDE